MKTSTAVMVGALLLALIGAGAWWWQQQALSPEPVPAAPMASGSVGTAQPALAPASGPPAIAYPIAAAPAASAAGLPPATDMVAVLSSVFGRQAVLKLVQSDDFARRFVATVDNLGRSTASSRLWPLHPAPGRFTVVQRDGRPVIGADNGMRYTPHVLLLESVGAPALGATYVHLYPQFQQAYEALGFPGRYFNDRLVEVIDQLLATPVPNAPLVVNLPTANSPVTPVRPWVLYVFDDPALQSLTAGQKILLRMGPVNQRRVQQQLRALRAQIAGAVSAR